MTKKKTSNNSTSESNGSTSKFHYVSYLIQIILSIIAAYLSWKCSHNRSMPVRLLLSGLAFFLSVYYLIFYLIFKVIMGQTC